MSLIKWNDVNRFPVFPSSLLDNFFNKNVSDLLDHNKSTLPSVNIIENDNEYKIEVVAPGLAKENFNVKVEDLYLIISAKREQGEENKNEKYHRREFKSSSFVRSFFIPEVIDAEKIKAEYKDGILFIALPKKDEEKKKQEVKHIEIS